MGKSVIIRACQLQKGDYFIKLGMRYKVVFIKYGFIHYTIIGDCKEWYHLHLMGAKSQERVTLCPANETISSNNKTNKDGNYSKS